MRAKCDGRRSTDTMHLISRSAWNVRHDPENAVGGCRECHEYMTCRPQQWKRWWRNHLGDERADALLAKATDPRTKPDFESAARILRQEERDK